MAAAGSGAAAARRRQRPPRGGAREAFGLLLEFLDASSAPMDAPLPRACTTPAGFRDGAADEDEAGDEAEHQPWELDYDDDDDAAQEAAGGRARKE